MKKYNPTSPARRQAEVIDFPFSCVEPYRKLTRGFHRSVGRSRQQGIVTTRHKGGGVKRLWRAIDFVYDKKDIPARIETIEYDPNRTSFIALALYRDGERRYVLVPQGVAVGDTFIVSEKAPLESGNRLPLKNIPVGTSVFNIELRPGQGAKLSRSAGTSCQVLATEGGYTQLKMPSGEIRKISSASWATIGALSNPERNVMTFGKAGRMRRLGIRPTVRGVAMNPREHLYGGGEGRQPRGTRKPKSMWGKVTHGVKTRRNKRTDVFIIRRRSK